MASRIFNPAWILILAGTFTQAWSAPADKPLKDLARVEAFAFGGIGVAGTKSAGEIDFRAILAQPSALADFRKLLVEGNRQAKCYALVALHKLQPKEFPALAASFAKDKAPVRTIGGCMVADLPMNSVVAGISKGNYDLYLRPDSR